MKELEQRILKDGKVLPGDILKVGNFLNQLIDSDLLDKMAVDVLNHFKGKRIDKILTIEASGIAFAAAIALKAKVPFAFAKKSFSSNMSGEMASSKAHSYSHGTDNVIILPKEYIKSGENVLIVDDFLANGEACNALIDIVNQCNANVIGIAIEIEKGFQDGGKKLKERGIELYSLASIKSMSLENIKFN